MRQRSFTVLILSVAVSLLAGCSSGTEVTARAESAPRPTEGDERQGSGAPSTTAGESEDGPAQNGPLCDAAQRIRDLDDRSSQIMTAATSGAFDDPEQAVERLRSAVAELQPMIPQLTAAYEDLAGAAPEALRDDIGLLRDFTLSVMEQLSALDSPEDLARLEAQLDPNTAMAASAATLEIDAVTQETCGISIAG